MAARTRVHIKRSPWAPYPMCRNRQPYVTVFVDPRFRRTTYAPKFSFCASCVRKWERARDTGKGIWWPPEGLPNQEEVL